MNLRTYGANITGGKDPATIGSETFKQPPGSTVCGSTTLIALAAQSDPFLAYWLQTGELLAGHKPAYIDGGIDLSKAGDTAADRIDFLQHQVQNSANPAWYNHRIGTYPWGANTEANRTGVEYQLNWSGNESKNTELVTAAAESANHGTPIPILVGSMDGLLPNHYVLITGYHDDAFTVYDPGSGKSSSVSYDVMLHGSDDSQAGFGGWNKVYAMLNTAD
jgi:hypothetical protein